MSCRATPPSQAVEPVSEPPGEPRAAPRATAKPPERATHPPPTTQGEVAQKGARLARDLSRKRHELRQLCTDGAASLGRGPDVAGYGIAPAEAQTCRAAVGATPAAALDEEGLVSQGARRTTRQPCARRGGLPRIPRREEDNPDGVGGRLVGTPACQGAGRRTCGKPPGWHLVSAVHRCAPLVPARRSATRPAARPPRRGCPARTRLASAGFLGDACRSPTPSAGAQPAPFRPDLRQLKPPDATGSAPLGCPASSGPPGVCAARAPPPSGHRPRRRPGRNTVPGTDS